MKKDLDALMQAHDIDTLFVVGAGDHNPPMVYLTGGAHLTEAELIKKRGAHPVLFHNPMEREEAAKTGLVTKNVSAYRPKELLDQMNGDRLKATVTRYRQMLTDLDAVSGRMAVYGQIDAGRGYAIFSELQKALPGLTIIGEVNAPLFQSAMETKDESEVQRIRRMGKITTSVVGEVAEFLTSQRAKEGVLVKTDGSPLTVGEVKNRINMWLSERGAENPEGTIFATGHDAAIPHSSGDSAALLRLGEPIVFDIFPCEAGGGYFYDFTRTWCLGYAPDRVQALYEDVLSVYRRVLSDLRAGAACKDYQALACELFEAKGHPTLQSDPVTEEGYPHSLGHGLGLHVHEKPFFGMFATGADRLVPGIVFTIEPGLYYPAQNTGVRLEDSLWATPEGNFEILAEYPLDLVLPLK
jgi:Xaa-Pro aminopeptidase